jgi:hypothetical protein
MLLVVVSFVASLVAGAVTRRWLAVVVAVALWPLYYAGLLLGIWGSGLGDGWEYAAALLTVACAAGGVAGVGTGTNARWALGRTLAGPPKGGLQAGTTVQQRLLN